MGEIRLRAHRLSRSFRGQTVVDDVNLAVPAGRVNALVGLNGAGKTTLLRLLLAMLRPDGGTAYIDGHDVKDADKGVWRQVGHLIEHPFVYPELDAQTNLAVAAKLRGVPRAAIPGFVDESMSLWVIERYADRRARVLSAGNLWRLGLAAALIHRPEIIVLDEPTNALDPAGIILLREYLLRRAGSGAAVLVSSHHLDEVARVADRITVINRGRAIGTLDPGTAGIERAFFELVHADDEQEARP